MTRRTIVVGIAALFLAAFAGGSLIYTNSVREAAQLLAQRQAASLIKPHALVIGPPDAEVTVVEFFDPSCETCRAFYPVVKQIMAMYPDEVNLVMRYATFHQGSDEAVRILEAARRQSKFPIVVETLLAKQPEWAIHDQPDLEKAWGFAGAVGLDIAKGRIDGAAPEVDEVLRIDAEDAGVLGVQQTPTFFVNGRLLIDFGPQQLYDLVTEEVMKARANG